MEKFILTVRVAEAALRETGDRGPDRAGENVVSVALLWPRPGKAEVMGSTGLVRLTDHVRKSHEPDTPPLFAVPVLKEVVQGDVSLVVNVTDIDRRGAFTRFLQAVAARSIESAAGQLTAGTTGVLRHAFSEAAEQGSMTVKGGKDDERIDVVAVGRKPVLLSSSQLRRLARSDEAKLVRVSLSAPQRLPRPREKGRLAAGRSNGHLVLEFHAVEA